MAATQSGKKGMSPRLKQILIGGICIILVVALAAGIVANTRRKNGTALKKSDAITVNDVDYKALDVSFYYNVFKNQYASYNDQIYASYGFKLYDADFSKSLFDQTYDQETGLSWGDYLVDQAVETLYNYIVLETAGKAAGYEMPEEAYDSIDETVEALETSASNNNVTVAYLLTANYGTGVTLEKFREMAEREAYASYYGQYVRDNIEVTQDDIDSYYSEHTDDFDGVTYRSFVLEVELPEHLDENGKVVSDDATKAEDEAVIAEKLAELKKRVDAVTSEEDFTDLAEEMTRSTDSEGKEVDGVTPEETLTEDVSYSSMSEDLQKWMFAAERKAGDTTILENSAKLTAYYFVERDTHEYLTRNVRHILLTSDEESDEVKAKAEELLAQWEAGDKTAEAFGELAKANSADTGSVNEGGLYENVGRGEMVEEFDAWLYDEARKPGDTGIVFTDDFGYHIMYYVGEGRAYRDVLVDSTIRDERYEACTEELEKTYPLTRNESGLSKIK